MTALGKKGYVQVMTSMGNINIEVLNCIVCLFICVCIACSHGVTVFAYSCTATLCPRRARISSCCASAGTTTTSSSTAAFPTSWYGNSLVFQEFMCRVSAGECV